MQGYRVLEESILYRAGNYSCELQFIRCTEPHKAYHIYDLELIVDEATSFELYEQAVGEAQGTFHVSGLRKLIFATSKVLDNWCRRHPYTFVSFFDCLSGLFRIYFKLGFVCDGRVNTFVAYVNNEGKRTAFRGMLNLLAEDDFWVNDLWRVAKDSDYYVGQQFTPVDFFKQLFTGMGLAVDRPSPITIEGDYSALVTAVQNRLQGLSKAKLLTDFAEPLGGKGQLRRYGSEEQQIIFVIRQGTRIATIRRNCLKVMGLVYQEENSVKYDLSSQTVENIVAAVNSIDVSACEIAVSSPSSLAQQ